VCAGQPEWSAGDDAAIHKVEKADDTAQLCFFGAADRTTDQMMLDRYPVGIIESINDIETDQFPQTTMAI
jgi:hypothetical protein